MAKFHKKTEMSKVKIKNALFGYFGVKILKTIFHPGICQNEFLT